MASNVRPKTASNHGDTADASAWADVSDTTLVERVRGGDVPLFEALMRRYNQRLFRVSRAIVGNASEAEDVMQEAYIRAFTHLEDLRDAERFAGWLTRIAVHEARTRVRQRQRQQALVQAADNLVVLAPGRRSKTPCDPERAAHNLDLRQALSAAVDSLSSTHREVWILREVEGLGSSEVAECLSISVASVRVRLHRARTALRTEVLRRLNACRSEIFQFLGHRCDRVVSRVFVRLGRTFRPLQPTDEPESQCTDERTIPSSSRSRVPGSRLP